MKKIIKVFAWAIALLLLLGMWVSVLLSLCDLCASRKKDSPITQPEWIEPSPVEWSHISHDTLFAISPELLDSFENCGYKYFRIHVVPNVKGKLTIKWTIDSTFVSGRSLECK